MDGLRLFIGSEKHPPSLPHGATEGSGAKTGPFDLNVFNRSSQVDLKSCINENTEPDRSASANSNLATLSSLTGDYSQFSIDRLSLTSEAQPTCTQDSTHGLSDMANSVSPLGSKFSTAQHGLPGPTLQRPNDFGRASPDSSSQIAEIFTKAANVVGYALELDGLTFFDAITTGAQCTADRSSSFFTDDEHSEPTAYEDNLLAKPLSEYRYDDGAEEQIVRKLSQSMIQRLTARYPQGHVFAIDDYGVLNYESDHDLDPDQHLNGSTVADNDWKEFFECVPKARYAIFMPLWHYQRESCFASCLAWVSDISKTLDNNDVNSLAAFGNSLMIEILRLEASANTQSKSDFVSSISHELRSPLHGISATVELVQENTRDSRLLSMMDMIESCSSTLLDTFDNLLEFARINSRTSDVVSVEADRRKPFTGNTFVKKTLVDLSLLVEEVLEVVSLGHSSALQLQFGLHKERQHAPLDETQTIPPRPLLVTTNIEKNFDWVMLIETATWKRILASIFSNAFKFTDSGYIDVRLKMLESANGSPRYISFSVTDTGIGMSPEFLKYHLFTPFMQENNLSPGTGLGLSIAKSLVESLGGKIFIKSRQREGTRVTIQVPLDQDRKNLNRRNIDTTATRENKLQGLSLGLLSVVADGPTNSELQPRIVSPPRVLQLSIRNMCEKVFGMTVVNASADTIPKTNMILLDLHALTTTDELGLRNLLPRHTSETNPPSIVVLGPQVEGLAQVLDVEEVTYIDSLVIEKNVRAALLAASIMADANKSKSSMSHSVGVEQDAPYPTEQIYSKDLPMEDTTNAAHNKHTDLSLGLALHQVTTTTKAETPKISKQPQMPFSQEASTTETSSSSSTVSRFKRFLLVDDNPINLKVLAAFAKRIGCPFSTASDGAEAVRLYQKAALEEADPFDCVFMDISMPVMDGFQAVAAIRRLEKQHQQQLNQNTQNTENDLNMPASAFRSYILALTGLGSEQARNAAKNSGFDEFILKPIKFKDITSLLKPISVSLV